MTVAVLLVEIYQGLLFTLFIVGQKFNVFPLHRVQVDLDETLQHFTPCIDTSMAEECVVQEEASHVLPRVQQPLRHVVRIPNVHFLRVRVKYNNFVEACAFLALLVINDTAKNPVHFFVVEHARKAVTANQLLSIAVVLRLDQVPLARGVSVDGKLSYATHRLCSHSAVQDVGAHIGKVHEVSALSSLRHPGGVLILIHREVVLLVVELSICLVDVSLDRVESLELESLPLMSICILLLVEVFEFLVHHLWCNILLAALRQGVDERLSLRHPVHISRKVARNCFTPGDHTLPWSSAGVDRRY